MTIFTSLADFLLYVAFAYLAGSVVLAFVPEDRKPEIRYSKKLLLACVAGIALFSAAPLIELVVFLGKGEGWITTFFTVAIESRVGHGWLITVFLSLVLAIAVFFKSSKFNQAYYLLLLILVVGFFSHVSTIDLWPGFVYHSIHFLFMAMWSGVLLHVAWFSKDGTNWPRFLAWFTPFAIVCFIGLIASGVLIMVVFVDPSDYASSWALPYGQMLLLKHLSIVPLLMAAFINGFLNKRRAFEKMWLKVESLLVLCVFLFTAFMSKQAPPHNINNTFLTEGAAPLVKLLKGDQFIPIEAVLEWSSNGMMLLAMGLVFLGMMLLGNYRRVSSWLLFLFGLAFIVVVYIGLMMNVSF
ncbi:copper resistance D family protein [Planococcus sp. YIM B11945]|uniref:copper resistance D family protein n=1 Tax=Planococcus sp. YIM B11945 TaxID=3435410 RepID=UPI003D7D25E0